MWISVCLCFPFIFLLALYVYFKWSFGYWKRNRIPYLLPTIPFGTISNPLRITESFADTVLRQYKESKTLGYRYVGLFGLTNPQFMMNDPNLIQNILIKDFNYFTDRGFYYNEKEDPLSAHIFSLSGQKWMKLRTKITPTFTASKIKAMTEFIIACGEQLKTAMSQKCTNGPMEIKHTMELFTTDVIGHCAFGIQCNSFTNPNSDFCKYSKRQFLPTTYENLKMFIGFMFPGFSKFIGMKVVSKEVTNFFMNTIKKAVEHRKNKQLIRNDYLQLLINMTHFENNLKSKNTISFDELAAQSFVLFIGSFETSSSTMSFCLYELALNPDIQQKIREEIKLTLKEHYDKVTYDSIKEMKYLDCVLSEVLRKYPPFPILNRRSVADYKIPDTDQTLEKGISVVIPVIGLQNDPQYFPNPETFDPERFNKTNTLKHVPFSYMPFGEGKRMCLGARFGLLQVKVGLVYLLKNFEFTMSDKMKSPLKLTPISFVLSVEGGIWLNVKEIKTIE